MTRRQINRLEQKRKAQKKAKEGMILFNYPPAAQMCLEDLDIQIARLEEIQKAQVEGTKPDTRSKEEGRLQMKNLTLWLAGVLHTYAAREGNNRLKQIASIVPSDLDEAGDSDFASQCIGVLECAEEIGSGILSQYGLDFVTLQDARTEMDALKALLDVPRYTRAELAGMGRMIPVHLENAKSILLFGLRNIFALYRESHPQFWEEFEATLRVFDVRGRKKKKEEIPSDDSQTTTAG
jgi:hypothetical protein